MTSPGENSDPSAVMMRLLGGFQVSQALFVVTRLDICTLLDDGPLTVGELAERSGAAPQPLGRVIRALVPLGVFRTVDGRVATTPLGAVLSRHRPGTLANIAMMWMDMNYLPFSELLHTVRTEEPGAERYFGTTFFAWVTEKPERTELFARAMADATGSFRKRVFETYRLPPGRVVADIGGADGSVLAKLLTGQEERQGIVFDLPAMAPVATRAMAERGLADRVRIVSGDFFTSVPAADIYLLNFVLHDWADDEAVALLSTVREAAPEGARLLVIEGVVPDDDEPHAVKMIDLLMLSVSRGRERTEREYRALIEQAGFTVDRLVPTESPFTVLECTARPR